MILCIYGCAGSLLLPTCFFLVAASRGLLSSCSAWLFIVAASLIPSTGSRACGLQWLQHTGSVVLAPRISSCGTQALVALRNVDSSQISDRTCVSCIGRIPLSHQGSPKYQFLTHKKVKRFFAPTSNTPKHRLAVRFKYVIYEILSHTFNYAL